MHILESERLILRPPCRADVAAMAGWLGDYQVAFTSAGLLALVAAGLVIRIGRKATPAEGKTRPVLNLEAEAPTGS